MKQAILFAFLCSLRKADVANINERRSMSFSIAMICRAFILFCDIMRHKKKCTVKRFKLFPTKESLFL